MLEILVQPTEVAPKAGNRRFSASYNVRILNEAEACPQPGEIGVLLRREGLYSSHMALWRRRLDEGTAYSWT